MGLNIAVTSKYKPFTYEDYIKPLEKYFENYEKHEAALEALGTTAESLSYIIDAEPEGSPLRNKYENYKKQLQAATDALADGYNAKDRELLSNLKKVFKRDLEPIGTGYKRRQDMIDEQRKFKITHPSIVYSNDASSASVWDFVDNPTWSYNSFIGDTLTKKVQDMVAPIAQIIQKATEGEDIGQYDTILKQYGATPQDVLTYISNGTGKLAKYFKFVEDSVVQSSGVLDWDDKNDDFLNKAYDFTKLGLPKAIGKADIIPITGSKSDKGGGSNASDAYRGPSYRISTTVPYTSKDKQTYEDSKKEFESLIWDHKGIPHTQKEYSLLGEFQKYGITPENITAYEKYLTEIAKANTEHLSNTVNLPQAGMPMYASITNYRADAVRNKPENVLFRAIEKDLPLKKIKEYRAEAEKARAYSARGMKPRSPRKSGSTDQFTIYGGQTFEEDARKAIELENRQAAQEIAILTPTWTGSTHNNDVLRQLKNDYNHMIKEKKGNGLYKINLSDGTRDWVKEENAKKILADEKNTSIVYTIQHGMLINNDGNYYILKGSKMTGPSEDVAHIYNSLRNFSFDAINEYQNATERDMYPVYNKYPNEMNAYELFKKLDRQNALAEDSKNNKNNLYAYIQVSYTTSDGEKVNDLVKVLYDRSGVFLGWSSVNSELGSNPASASYALDHAHPMIFRTPNEITNKYTDPASREKGANPQLPQYY